MTPVFSNVSDVDHQRDDGEDIFLDWRVGRVPMSVRAKRTHHKFKSHPTIVENPFLTSHQVLSIHFSRGLFRSSCYGVEVLGYFLLQAKTEWSLITTSWQVEKTRHSIKAAMIRFFKSRQYGMTEIFCQKGNETPPSAEVFIVDRQCWCWQVLVDLSPW